MRVDLMEQTRRDEWLAHMKVVILASLAATSGEDRAPEVRQSTKAAKASKVRKADSAVSIAKAKAPLRRRLASA
jgi:hypothetical protein